MTNVEHAIPREELMEYVDGGLPAERRAAVARHLAACAECQRAAAELRDVSVELHRWTIEPAPPSLRAPEMPVGARRSGRVLSGRWPLAWRPAAVAAVAVLAVAATWIAAVRPGRFMVEKAPVVHTSSPVAHTVADRAEPAPRAAMPARPFAPAPTTAAQTPREPKVIRTIALTLVAKEIEAARQAIDRIVSEVGGFVGQIHVSGGPDEPSSLRATLRVPAARAAAATERLRTVGRVVDETQTGDDVTEQVVDLEARLANHRNTERRLNEVLKNRTGRVADVLEVEREIARVREEIERLDGQRSTLEDRVSYATITLQIREERRASLGAASPALTDRLRNALVDGVRAAYESILGAALIGLRVAPPLLLWIALLWWPARKAVRLLRQA